MKIYRTFYISSETLKLDMGTDIRNILSFCFRIFGVKGLIEANITVFSKQLPLHLLDLSALKSFLISI